mgnify:CR=1 FL=1
MTLVYMQYHFLLHLYHEHIPITTISLAHMYTNSILNAKKRDIYQSDTSILIYLYTNLLTSKFQPLRFIFKR